jgi:hypothetical protein
MHREFPNGMECGESDAAEDCEGIIKVAANEVYKAITGVEPTGVQTEMMFHADDGDEVDEFQEDDWDDEPGETNPGTKPPEAKPYDRGAPF